MEVEAILQALLNGSLSIGEASEKLKNPPFEDLGFAKLDYQRELRRGFGEVVFCPGKTIPQLQEILLAFFRSGRSVLATRCSPEQYQAVVETGLPVDYNACSRLLVLRVGEARAPLGNIAVCTGGTADMPVAEEAAQTAEFFGAKVQRHYDVGVAGIHRLMAKIDDIRQANAIVAVAGMEGALAGVVAGLVDRPVIAVPTSVGYGASFEGLSPLLTMINSCAEGIAVVNIDNGFGAGYLAAQINRLAEGKR